MVENDAVAYVALPFFRFVGSDIFALWFLEQLVTTPFHHRYENYHAFFSVEAGQQQCCGYGSRLFSIFLPVSGRWARHEDLFVVSSRVCQQ